MKFETLDVFTNDQFGGNPLAVVWHEAVLTDALMQKIANEFNLSETIFIDESKSFEGNISVRIFTPSKELPFAGHPTIGATIAIARRIKGTEFEGNISLILNEKAGLVPVEVDLKSGADFASFIAPKMPRAEKNTVSDATFAKIIGLDISQIGMEGHLPLHNEAGNNFYCLPLKDKSAIENIKMDYALAKQLMPENPHLALYCYARDDAHANYFHTRMFSLDVDSREDPATGSAVAAFGASLILGEGLSSGVHKFSMDQGVQMGRASKLSLKISLQTQFADIEALNQATKGDIMQEIGGNAVLISKGELFV